MPRTAATAPRALVALGLGAGLALAFSACASPARGPGDGGSGSPAELDGTWTLVSASDADGDYLPDAALVPGPVTLEIDGDEARGQAPCNGYAGELRVTGDRIDIGPLTSTEIGCDGGELEVRYLAALDAVDRVEADASGLALDGEGISLRYERGAAPPDDGAGSGTPPGAAELDGTSWALRAILASSGDATDGTSSSTTVEGRPRLVLDAGGRASGSAGCREFSGTWSIDDDVLAIADLEAQAADCPAAFVTQEETMLGALRQGAEVTLGDERMTLAAEMGAGTRIQFAFARE
ncbi:META domain-containing protein [Homoserinibacter sp. YIM 151385]|uniref:META domain-containing protein n=1 Tax=Homoserinibacter sp. YIM 151385 TaxID=2985506 RepID=UPI0022F01531|nr:META domain-containing protein [Homoserinibacter sp. YIM 151385]WBU39130.1 META domain-containing protein [Homoserinibacter sp. YIM 151385]